MLGLPSRIVSVPQAAIRFCRYATAVLLWTAYLAHIEGLALALAVLLVLNAALGVRRAPLVALYAATVHRRWPGAVSQVDECALRFAHIIAATAACAAAALVYQPERAWLGWIILACLAFMKTLGAVFMCPVSGLYACLAGGGECCSWLRKRQR